MSVGKRLEYRGYGDDPQREYRVLCLNEKHQAMKEIETKILISGSHYYIRYNAQNFWVYEWNGPEARYAILLYDPANI